MKSLFTAASLIVLLLQPLLAQDENAPETTAPVKVTPSEKAVMEKAAAEKAVAAKVAAKKEAAAKVAAKKAAAEKAAEKVAAEKAAKASAAEAVAQKAAAEKKAAADKVAKEKAEASTLALISQTAEKNRESQKTGLSMWVYVVFGSAIGALLSIVAIFFLYRKQNKTIKLQHREHVNKLSADCERKLRENSLTINDLKEGVGGVKLLDDEAILLLKRFEHDNKVVHENVLRTAAANKEVTDKFKESLNANLGGLVQNIRSVMETAAADAKKTKDYLDVIVPQMEENKAENERLKKGYNVQLIGPLLESFFLLRDNLQEHIAYIQSQFAQGSRATSDEGLQYLIDLESEIAHSIHGVGLDEIKFFNGDNMREYPQVLWTTTPVAQNNQNQELHGRCALTKRIGYKQRKEGTGDVYIVRKATVQLYIHVEQLNPINPEIGGVAEQQAPPAQN
jgi:hypothetical protein